LHEEGEPSSERIVNDGVLRTTPTSQLGAWPKVRLKAQQTGAPGLEETLLLVSNAHLHNRRTKLVFEKKGDVLTSRVLRVKVETGSSALEDAGGIYSLGNDLNSNKKSTRPRNIVSQMVYGYILGKGHGLHAGAKNTSGA